MDTMINTINTILFSSTQQEVSLIQIVLIMDLDTQAWFLLTGNITLGMHWFIISINFWCELSQTTWTSNDESYFQPILEISKIKSSLVVMSFYSIRKLCTLPSKIITKQRWSNEARASILLQVMNAIAKTKTQVNQWRGNRTRGEMCWLRDNLG